MRPAREEHAQQGVHCVAGPALPRRSRFRPIPRPPTATTACAARPRRRQPPRRQHRRPSIRPLGISPLGVRRPRPGARPDLRPDRPQARPGHDSPGRATAARQRASRAVASARLVSVQSQSPR